MTQPQVPRRRRALILALIFGALTVVGAPPAAATDPGVQSVEPRDGAVEVSRSTSVVVNLSEPLSGASVSHSTVRINRPDGRRVRGSYNTDAAGSLVSFTPRRDLKANRTYTLRTTDGLKTARGVSFERFTSTFTTGARAAEASGLAFDRTTTPGATAPTSITRGPNGRLYVGTGIGEVLSYELDNNGVPVGSPRVFTPFGEFSRTIIGLRFDPASTSRNLKLWVSHGELGIVDVPNSTGKVSVLTGPDLVARDVIVGLPRSVKDHMTNGLDFGPDGRLYIAQGSNNGYGGAEPGWGGRPEDPLSAAILVADVNRLGFPGTVDVTPGRYDADASSAPVKRYATGVRNAYDLAWHPNGRLYAPVNESAGGSTPADPEDGVPAALTGLGPGRDFLAEIQQGRYYGHPNPSIDRYVLNGGNPSTGIDPWEVPKYPVGTQPESNWTQPLLDFGTHRSANGIAVYRNANRFEGALFGHLLVAEFSNGDDIVDIAIGPDGGVTGRRLLAEGFNNPLDVFVNARKGIIYVAEYGDSETGEGGAVTTLRPQG